jgi:hypothetical protein
VSWWLTRESGRVPICVDLSACGCGDESSQDDDVIAGYVIVKHSARWSWTRAACSEVCIGRLLPETLFVVEHRLVPFLRAVVSDTDYSSGVSASQRVQEWTCVASGASSFVGSGAFSHGFLCGCVFLSKCTRCKQASSERARFVAQDRYLDIFPDGPMHWWRGVTDGVGFVRDGIPWLRCLEEGTRVSMDK